jgi:hypothetical protein
LTISETTDANCRTAAENGLSSLEEEKERPLSGIVEAPRLRRLDRA